MSYDNEWLHETLENRHKSVADTMRPATVEELKEVGMERFPSATDPWFESYIAFLDENRNAKFYRAELPDGGEVIYCRTAGKGVWFSAGKGMGIVQPKSLALLAEIADTL